MTLAVAARGPADLRDQRWLDERIDAARDGIEAVIEIAENWTDGRTVSRLHPGVSAADYVREHVGIVARSAIVPLLERSNWSNRQIATVTGVSHPTVGRIAAATGSSVPVDRADETLGADGKLRAYPTPEPPAVLAVVVDDPDAARADYRAVIVALRSVANLDPDLMGRVALTTGSDEYAALNRLARRAERVAHALGVERFVFEEGSDPQ